MGQTLTAETQLASIFREQLAQYTTAMQVIDEIESRFQQHHDAETELAMLNRIMTQVAAQDQQAGPLRDEVFSAPDKLSAEMRDISQQLTGTVELMLSRVQTVEDLARAAKDRLSPQISHHVAAKQMVNAYQNG